MLNLPADRPPVLLPGRRNGAHIPAANHGNTAAKGVRVENNRYGPGAVERASEAFNLLVQLDDERIRKYEELTSACETLRAENESLGIRIRDAETAALESSRKAAAAEARLESSRSEIDRLRVENDARDARVKRTDKQLLDVQAERESLKARLESKDNELAESYGRLEALTDAMNERFRLASERVSAPSVSSSALARRHSTQSIETPPAMVAIAPPVAEEVRHELVVVDQEEYAPSTSAQVLTLAPAPTPAAQEDVVRSPEEINEELDRDLANSFDNWSEADFAPEGGKSETPETDELDARSKSLMSNFGGLFRSRSASGS
jgi:hypothetical protein